ncbi:MAG TPA: hypothetical protein VGJ05_12195 [Fimbriiglobus sp.]
MTSFELQFADGRVTGRGTDVIGVFTIKGDYESATGKVAWVKQYLGKHRVLYTGMPDGEGCILGTWTVEMDGVTNKGPFLLKPELPRPTGDEPIHEIQAGGGRRPPPA